jgi:3-deoxy-D-manno-octulosonate 8-phosphate phosphatase KdsC-like HAD superfamily phosphatase
MQVKSWKTYCDQEVFQGIYEQSHEIKYLVENRTIIEQNWIYIGKDSLHENKDCINQC